MVNTCRQLDFPLLYIRKAAILSAASDSNRVASKDPAWAGGVDALVVLQVKYFTTPALNRSLATITPDSLAWAALHI